MSHQIKSGYDLEVLLERSDAMLLYFYSDRCAPCIQLRPKVEDLVTAQFPQMMLAFIDSDSYPMLAARYSVFSNPTLILLFEGKEYKRLSKYVSVEQLAQVISRPYGLMFD